mgnify:CR=1 FL=1
MSDKDKYYHNHYQYERSNYEYERVVRERDSLRAAYDIQVRDNSIIWLRLDLPYKRW